MQQQRALHLDVTHAFARVPLEEEIYTNFTSDCGAKFRHNGQIHKSIVCIRAVWTGLEFSLGRKVGWRRFRVEQSKTDPCAFRQVVAREVDIYW